MKKITKTIKYIFPALIVILITTTIVTATGSLTPTGTAGDNTHYSLKDIYNKLTTGTTNLVATSSPITVPGTVSATFPTLTEIYEAVPDWVTLSNSTTTVSEGYYEATTLDSVDSDLSANNIRQNTEVFGVTGTLEEDDASGLDLRSEWSTDDQGPGYVNWPTAVSACQNLSEGGHNDWELPTSFELHNAFIKNVSGFQAAAYWTITDYPSSPDQSAYYSSMNTGSGGGANKISTNTVLTRCIR